MSKLEKYASTSSLMDITIKFGKEIIKFNLYKEVSINDDDISGELIIQPKIYSFLLMAHKQLIKNHAEIELEANKAYNKAYIKYKTLNNPATSRPYPDEYAKAKAENNLKYLKLQRQSIDLKYQLNRIESCVRSFEQRKDILQTLSANRRKEVE
jgi:hypothetical protein